MREHSEAFGAFLQTSGRERNYFDFRKKSNASVQIWKDYGSLALNGAFVRITHLTLQRDIQLYVVRGSPHHICQSFGRLLVTEYEGTREPFWASNCFIVAAQPC